MGNKNDLFSESIRTAVLCDPWASSYLLHQRLQSCHTLGVFVWSAIVFINTLHLVHLFYCFTCFSCTSILCMFRTPLLPSSPAVFNPIILQVTVCFGLGTGTLRLWVVTIYAFVNCVLTCVWSIYTYPILFSISSQWKWYQGCVIVHIQSKTQSSLTLCCVFFLSELLNESLEFYAIHCKF